MIPGAADEEKAVVPPPSAFVGPIGELIAQRVLDPPARPGLLAVLGRFEITKLLGSGGMGVVLLAKDPQSGNDVAIKLIKPGLQHDEHIMHRFVKEASHMQKLKQANIVPVLEVTDESQHGPYFVMPYFAMGSLARQIRPGKALATDVVLSVARQVADGLQFAHQKGIIHRDLKPANILVGTDGTVCLADFGLARTFFNDTIVDPSLQQCEGTGPYMSPGVAAGNAEDTRCDIYAFGAILYEMLTGEPPYTGTTTQEIRNKILTAGPRPISSVNAAADPKLTKVAESAMGRELRDRYAGMGDIAADLLRIREGKSPLGHGARGFLGGNLRSIRKLSCAGGVVVLILAGALLLYLKPWHRGNAHYDSTSREVSTVPIVSTAPEAVPSLKETAAAPAPIAKPKVSESPVPTPTLVTKESEAPKAPAASNAAFPLPIGIFADPSGSVFVLDQQLGAIERLKPSKIPGVLDLVQISPSGRKDPSARIHGSARGFAFGGEAGIYFTDGFQVKRIDGTQAIATVAGKEGIPGSQDGDSDAARFENPTGIAVDDYGTIYVADTYTIREIDKSGTVRTFAGENGHAGRHDGAGTLARFGDQAKGLAYGADGNLYVADSFNSAIRKISASGVVVTVAGSGRRGSQDGVGSSASFNRPYGIAIGRSGEVFVADSFNDTVRRIDSKGLVSTFAGKAGEVGSLDGQGVDARFNNPRAIAIDDTGVIWVADTGNKVVRRIALDGSVTTVQIASSVAGQVN